MFIGAHKSIAGSIEKSIWRALADGCECLQIFVKNKNRWDAKPLKEEDAAVFRAELAKSGLRVCAHASYLINPASPDAEIAKKSMLSFREELRRCDMLNVPYYVMHPGAHMKQGTQAGMERVADFLRSAYSEGDFRVTTLLETTSGMGTCLGHVSEEIDGIIRMAGNEARTGVCLDSCHIFAAGYDIADHYDDVFKEFFEIFGDRIKVFHLNDSKKPLGSRLDRHELIADGLIGTAFFKRVINDTRFADTLGILETPVETDYKEEIEKLKSYRER